MSALRTFTIIGLAVTALWTTPVAASGSSPRRCNGSARLCNVQLGAVAFATTHNSMSSRADGFRGPNQGRTIPEQLQHGIRGFQIDAYTGIARDQSVYTELAGPFGSQATDLPPPLVAAAEVIHQRLGRPPEGSPTDVYLCHTFCELGAVSMLKTLQQVRTFLDGHPDEVLVMVIEDYVPPERLHAVFQAAGLAPMLLAVHVGDPLPTLGTMIQTGKRLMVSLENGDGGPTLPNAFTGLVEETPFHFVRPSGLTSAASCMPNRGTAGAPVFQLNHWLTPAAEATARTVNTRVLRSRVKQCTEVRGRPPTLVAVDFAENSDVLSVVEDINRGGP